LKKGTKEGPGSGGGGLEKEGSDLKKGRAWGEGKWKRGTLRGSHRSWGKIISIPERNEGQLKEDLDQHKNRAWERTVT